MPKKHLGQNFLFDPSILRRIIDVAELDPDDIVIEIGPGHGLLTRMIAEKVRKVIAIELDANLYEKLQQGFSGAGNIEYINMDAMKFEYEGIKKFKVVSNLPYYITTPIIFRLLQARNSLETMTITIQKEVAERIASGPGTKEYGALSIMVQLYTIPSIKFIIPKGAFRPVPKVDSAVLRIDIRPSPAVHISDQSLFRRIIKTAFSQRRKTVSNALKPLHENIKDILKDAGIDLMRRPETLTIQEYAHIAEIIRNKKGAVP